MSRFVVEIEKSLCVGCGGCNVFCEECILDVENGIAIVVTDLSAECRGCMECEEMCPEKAIKVKDLKRDSQGLGARY